MRRRATLQFDFGLPTPPRMAYTFATGMKMLIVLGCFLAGLVSAEDTIGKPLRKPSTMKSFFPGKEFFVDSVSIGGRWAVVFEDDGDAGYFYALDLEEENQGRQLIQEAMHIYNAANVTDANKESKAAIVWSEDGLKACLLINDYPHAIFDFASERGYCRTNFPKPGKWKKHDFSWDDEALELFRRKQETKGEQGGAGQPATRSESDSEGGDKPQPESERRSR